MVAQAIIQGMASIADGWWNEDRRDLYRSVEVIASDAPNPDRVGLCLDTILNDLELYDDPLQGKGSWLFDDEVGLAGELGEALHLAAGQRTLTDAGPTALASHVWPSVRRTAADLLDIMAQNGDFNR